MSLATRVVCTSRFTGTIGSRGILGSSLLKALLSCGLEFVAGNPAGERWQLCRLRSERKAKSCDDRIAGKIHVGTVLVAWLVITVRGEIFCLLLTPLRRMARALDAFIDRKRRHAHARQAEMVRTVIVAGFRARVRTDGQMKVPRRRLHHGIKSGALRAADFHLFRRPQWRHIVKVQTPHTLSWG